MRIRTLRGGPTTSESAWWVSGVVYQPQTQPYKNLSPSAEFASQMLLGAVHVTPIVTCCISVGAGRRR